MAAAAASPHRGQGAGQADGTAIFHQHRRELLQRRRSLTPLTHTSTCTARRNKASSHCAVKAVNWQSTSWFLSLRPKLPPKRASALGPAGADATTPTPADKPRPESAAFFRVSRLAGQEGRPPLQRAFVSLDLTCAILLIASSCEMTRESTYLPSSHISLAGVIPAFNSSILNLTPMDRRKASPYNERLLTITTRVPRKGQAQGQSLQ